MTDMDEARTLCFQGTCTEYSVLVSDCLSRNKVQRMYTGRLVTGRRTKGIPGIRSPGVPTPYSRLAIVSRGTLGVTLSSSATASSRTE